MQNHGRTIHTKPAVADGKNFSRRAVGVEASVSDAGKAGLGIHQGRTGAVAEDNCGVLAFRGESDAALHNLSAHHQHAAGRGGKLRGQCEPDERSG